MLSFVSIGLFDIVKKNFLNLLGNRLYQTLFYKKFKSARQTLKFSLRVSLYGLCFYIGQ
jgi:hypothetical protein